LKTAR